MGVIERPDSGQQPSAFATVNIPHTVTYGSEFQNVGTPRSDTWPDIWPEGVLWGLAGVAIVVACLVIIGFLVWLMRYSRKKSLEDYDLDILESSKTTSIEHSPISQKGPAKSHDNKAMLLRSLTTEMIPDFSLPPDRVQPSTAHGEKAPGESSLQYQHRMLGNVQPDLYSFSVDDDEGDSTPGPHGRLWFSLVYDAAVQELTVCLIKAKYLRGRDKGNSARDPFVKIYLLPDEKTCQESRVRRKTLTPKFNETFVFKVSEDDVMKRTLRFSVYDVDKKRVRHSLGHVFVPLGDTDLTTADVMYKDLEVISQNSGALGEISVSLTYVGATEKLKVIIHKARDLRQLDYDSEEEVYVRVQLVQARRGHAKSKRTASQRGTCDPVYNESFTFTLPSRLLDSCSVEITMFVGRSGRIGWHDEEYGSLVVGASGFASGKYAMHWQEMIAQPNTAITRWHSLTTTANSP